MLEAATFIEEYHRLRIEVIHQGGAVSTARSSLGDVVIWATFAIGDIWSIFVEKNQTDMQANHIRQFSIAEILEAEMKAIGSIPQDNPYDTAIELIIKSVHQGQGRLITSGMGKAGQIALNIATTFSSTGTPAYFVHPSEAQHGDLGMVRPGDILLLISNSGKTREVLELVELARHMIPDVPTILITGRTDSPLAAEVDVVLSTGNPPEVCPLGLTPTTSTTMMTVLGDVLVVQVMQRIGFDHCQYALRHHGGYLGAKSREQAEHK